MSFNVFISVVPAVLIYARFTSVWRFGESCKPFQFSHVSVRRIYYTVNDSQEAVCIRLWKSKGKEKYMLSVRIAKFWMEKYSGGGRVRKWMNDETRNEIVEIRKITNNMRIKPYPRNSVNRFSSGFEWFFNKRRGLFGNVKQKFDRGMSNHICIVLWWWKSNLGYLLTRCRYL